MRQHRPFQDKLKKVAEGQAAAEEAADRELALKLEKEGSGTVAPPTPSAWLVPTSGLQLAPWRHTCRLSVSDMVTVAIAL